jgi:hypothetical protein
MEISVSAYHILTTRAKRNSTLSLGNEPLTNLLSEPSIVYNVNVAFNLKSRLLAPTQTPKSAFCSFHC